MLKKSKIEYIIIAVCTYKRPDELDRLLNNLCDLNYPKCKTGILIIDNDIEESAKNIYKNFTDKLKILYVVEEKKGFANVRNCAVKKAVELGATHLAFIDDDEIADKDWLINHIDFYERFDNIYISSGPTYKKFEDDYPSYIVNNCTFKSVSRKKSGKIKKTCASGNVFFPLDIISESNVYFDTTFNSAGSEDTDFFGRLSAAGYLIGWNCDAINYEIVSTDRANIKWILQRAYKNGRSVSKINYKKCSKFKRFLYASLKLVTIIFEIIILPFTIFAGLTVFFNRLTNLVKNIGKLCSLSFG